MKKNEVFEDLRNRIVSGEFAPGDWLVERELSEMYGISRTPIREVLGKLSNLCIVEMQSSKGYQVKRLNLAEIIEIFNAREAIEGISA
ncbi:MAG TPA: GntR family transcriptional regulator, partial [Sphaerochaeta sp.]|nr:GntR family transcriptional regulator [Sphaerochaeta sp.]